MKCIEFYQSNLCSNSSDSSLLWNHPQDHRDQDLIKYLAAMTSKHHQIILTVPVHNNDWCLLILIQTNVRGGEIPFIIEIIRNQCQCSSSSALQSTFKQKPTLPTSLNELLRVESIFSANEMKNTNPQQHVNTRNSEEEKCGQREWLGRF